MTLGPVLTQQFQNDVTALFRRWVIVPTCWQGQNLADFDSWFFGCDGRKIPVLLVLFTMPMGAPCSNRSAKTPSGLLS